MGRVVGSREGRWCGGRGQWAKCLPGCVLRRGIPLLSVSQISQRHFFRKSTRYVRSLPSGIYTHINKHASQHAQHYVPGTGVGDLPKRRAKTQTFGTAVPIRWEGRHTEAAGCGGVCVNSVESRGGI